MGLKTDHLSGESIRQLFPKTEHTRDEVNMHIKRIGLLASRLEGKGVFVVASFLSPFTYSRDFVRDLCQNYIEVHVSTPIEVCEKKDKHKLYSRARRGEIYNLPGVNEVYEKPVKPELIVNLDELNIEDATDHILKYIKKYHNI